MTKQHHNCNHAAAYVARYEKDAIVFACPTCEQEYNSMLTPYEARKRLVQGDWPDPREES